MSVPVEVLKQALRQLNNQALHERQAVNPDESSGTSRVANAVRLGRMAAYNEASQSLRTYVNLVLRPEDQIKEEDIQPKS